MTPEYLRLLFARNDGTVEKISINRGEAELLVGILEQEADTTTAIPLADRIRDAFGMESMWRSFAYLGAAGDEMKTAANYRAMLRNGQNPPEGAGLHLRKRNGAWND